MIFIFSMSRSGSSWLGKIFDSHPDVLYRHEPDIVDRGVDLLPYWFEEGPSGAQIAAAGAYLKRLGRCRSVRAAGTRPFFSKNYRAVLPEQLRRGMIYADKLAERVIAESFGRNSVPDFINGAIKPKLVIKSVGANGRAEALIRAGGEEFKPILLIRDPRSYVSSMIRGARMGIMEPPLLLGRLAKTRSARKLEFPPGRMLDEIERHTWTWLLSNMEAHEAILSKNGIVLLFEALAMNRFEEAKSLFARVGLRWEVSTESFVARSASVEGNYYSVFRDPATVVRSWRKDLASETVSRIEAIVSRDPLGRSFL